MLHYKNINSNTKFEDIFGVSQHLELLRFSILYLMPSEKYSIRYTNEELILVPIFGSFNATVDGKNIGLVERIGNVFDNAPDILYVSRMSEVVVEATTESKIAVCRSVSSGVHEPFVLHSKDVKIEFRGKDQWKRTVRNIIVDNVDDVDHLVLGETINDPGQWSGYPPHKHEENRPPSELKFEEIYYFEFKPKNGFGVQVHYKSKYEEDRGYLIRSGDAFAIPDGYHPVVVAGGYRMYYLWFMAGPSGRKLKPYIDPEFSWVE